MARNRFHGASALRYGASGPLRCDAATLLTMTEASEATSQAMPRHTPDRMHKESTASMKMSYDCSGKSMVAAV